MKDIIGNVAQELADHLDDLRSSAIGVGDQDDDGDREFEITEVGDPELCQGIPGEPLFTFVTTIGGQRLRVTVGEA